MFKPSKRRSRRLLTFVACVAATIPAARAADDADAWILKGKRAYVSPDRAPIDAAVLRVSDGKIVNVESPTDDVQNRDMRWPSCQGGVITAGFHNSHVHLIDEGFAAARSASADELSRHLQQMLTRYGFTTVVDTGSFRDNTLALRSRIDGGDIPGPRILTVGLPLYPPDGIPAYIRDLPQALLDTLPQPTAVNDAVRVVRENLDAGADGTKLFVATPQLDRSLRRMPLDIAQAAVEETHRRGKLAMAHPTDIEGIRRALAANVDILVHTTLDEATAWPDSLVRELVARRVSVVPTLKLWGYELNKGKVPEDVQRRLISATLDQLRGFATAGGDVLFGTDVGYMSDFDPTEEYELMARAGLTPMQILASLTTAPAARWNEGDRHGRLQAGMIADIVVLEADPAADVKNFAEVRCVFRAGKAIYVAGQ